MPYVRVTRATFDPARYDASPEEFQRLAADTASAARGLPGCQSYVGAADFAAGRTVSISVFDTLEHAQFSREAMGGIVSRIQALGMQMEAPEFYEVVT